MNPVTEPSFQVPLLGCHNNRKRLAVKRKSVIGVSLEALEGA